MSQDEDIELKELVTEALEKNGVLAKIRAQLRASIFMTLENENDQKHQNSRLKDVLSTRDGLLTLLLVQELVEFCNLVQTSSVFKAETGHGKIYSYEGRQNLLEVLKMSSSVNKEVPVLVHLIQMVFKVIRSNDKLCTNSGNAANVITDGSNERSFNESGGSPNPGAENNTFLVNSGKSDHYDLSFDSESSVQDDKNVLLNMNNSAESNDSLSTEIAGKISSKDSMESDNVDSAQSSIKPDTPDLSQNAANDSSQERNSKSNGSQKSNMNSYSKYLSDKHKSNKTKPDTNDDAAPVDNIMKHFINSKLGDSGGNSDQSISEEILKAYSDSATWSDDSPRTESNASPPPRNILDDTLQESPSTKQRVNNQINNLKQQSLTSKDATTNITSKKVNDSIITSNLAKESVKSDIVTSVKNDKNSILDRENPPKANWSPLADLPTLVVNKNAKILPCYNVSKTSSESEPILIPEKVEIARKKTSVIVENVKHYSNS